MKTLKSNKGQALIEACALLLLTLPLLFLSLKLQLSHLLKMIIDEQIETQILCEMTEQTNCEENLKKFLRRVKIKNSEVWVQKDDKKIETQVKGYFFEEFYIQRKINRSILEKEI